VQPKDVASLSVHPFKLLVFLGANQPKLPVDLVASLQPFGPNVEYIRATGNGRNALDFHIACYLGELVAKNPTSIYRVISKDAGFDPLLAHLQSRGVHVVRSDTLSELPVPAVAVDKTFEERVATVMENLRRRGNARPRRRQTLASTIHALFGKKLELAEADGLIAALADRGVTIGADDKVTYAL
jgi:hypothetical protein